MTKAFEWQELWKYFNFIKIQWRISNKTDFWLFESFIYWTFNLNLKAPLAWSQPTLVIGSKHAEFNLLTADSCSFSWHIITCFSTVSSIDLARMPRARTRQLFERSTCSSLFIMKQWNFLKSQKLLLSRFSEIHSTLFSYHDEHMRKKNAEGKEKSLFASISHRRTWYEYETNFLFPSAVKWAHRR